MYDCGPTCAGELHLSLGLPNRLVHVLLHGTAQLSTRPTHCGPMVSNTICGRHKLLSNCSGGRGSSKIGRIANKSHMPQSKKVDIPLVLQRTSSRSLAAEGNLSWLRHVRCHLQYTPQQRQAQLLQKRNASSKLSLILLLLCAVRPLVLCQLLPAQFVQCFCLLPREDP